MSKGVTAEQGLSHGSLVLQGEELWTAVEKVWEQLPLDTIARAYSGHHQIVNAIAQCEGGDEFAKARGGLHFGIRKHCVPYFATDTSTTPIGVTMIEEYDNVEGEDASEGLKYPAPDVSSLAMRDYLNKQERDFLFKYLPRDSAQLSELAAGELLASGMLGNEAEEDEEVEEEEY